MVIYVECPHCNDLVEIVKINCGIFRHGVFKETENQLSPHAPKIICDKVFDQGLIYGCGKPFELTNINGNYVAIKCPYI